MEVLVEMVIHKFSFFKRFWMNTKNAHPYISEKGMGSVKWGENAIQKDPLPHQTFRELLQILTNSHSLQQRVFHSYFPH